MKPVTQNLFGGPDGAVELIGNCYPACIASVLELQLEEVPHFHQLHAKPEDALVEILKFLLPRGYSSLCFDWAPWVHAYFAGALVLVSGKSPRGDFQHVVVGEVTSDGWKLVHDPHPSREGIEGPPLNVEVLVPLLRLSGQP